MLKFAKNKINGNEKESTLESIMKDKVLKKKDNGLSRMKKKCTN